MNEQEELSSATVATAIVRDRVTESLTNIFERFLNVASPEERFFLNAVFERWDSFSPGATGDIVIASSFEHEIAERGEYFRIEDEDLADRVRTLIREANDPEWQKANEEPWSLQKIRANYSTSKPTGRDFGRTQKDLGRRPTCGESLTRFTPSLPSAEREFLAFCQVLFRATDEDGDRSPDSELLVNLILEWSSHALNPQKVEELVTQFNKRFKWRIAAAKSVISEYPYVIGIDVVTQIELALVVNYQTLSRTYPDTSHAAEHFLNGISQRIKNGAIVEPGHLVWEPNSKTIVERPVPAAPPETTEGQ